MITHFSNRRKAFTIVELMVVLAIGTIVAAIVVGGFRSVSEGNRKTSCQANLAQIYLASKQYAQDFDGRFPYFNGVSSSVAPNGGMANAAGNAPRSGFGLWTLYAFTPASPSVGSKDQNCQPENEFDHTNDAFVEPESGSRSLTGYARSLKMFHCPSDKYAVTVGYSVDNCGTLLQKTMTSGEPIFTTDVTNQRLINPFFMSYQGEDALPSAVTQTYSVYRQPYVPNNAVTGRQLQPFIVGPGATPGTFDTKPIKRLPDPTTVITWCRFHRSLSNRNTTIDGKRNYDNVLFYDGSVQFLPTRMNATNGSSTNTGGLTGWNRLPRGAFR